MKLLYTHENPALVGYAKNLVEDAGIQVTLKNEFSAGGMAPPYNLNSELWILDDGDFDTALSVLAPLLESVENGETGNTQGD